MAEDFPDDENGDVLRRMWQNGDDFTMPRKIDFSVVFPNKDSAEQFGARLRDMGYQSSVELTNSVPELPWDVVVMKQMLPLHEDITDFEGLLAAVASGFGGRNDGWGCMTQKR